MGSSPFNSAHTSFVPHFHGVQLSQRQGLRPYGVTSRIFGAYLYCADGRLNSMHELLNSRVISAEMKTPRDTYGVER